MGVLPAAAEELFLDEAVIAKASPILTDSRAWLVLIRSPPVLGSIRLAFPEEVDGVSKGEAESRAR